MNINNTLAQVSVNPITEVVAGDIKGLIEASTEFLDQLYMLRRQDYLQKPSSFKDIYQMQEIYTAANRFFREINNFLGRQVHLVYVYNNGIIAQLDVDQEEIIYGKLKLRDKKGSTKFSESSITQIAKKYWISERTNQLATWYRQAVRRFNAVNSFVKEIAQTSVLMSHSPQTKFVVKEIVNDLGFSTSFENPIVGSQILNEILSFGSQRGFSIKKGIPGQLGHRFYYYDTYPNKNMGNTGFIAQGYVSLINQFLSSNNSIQNYFNNKQQFLKELAENKDIIPENNIALIGGDVQDVKNPSLSYAVKKTDARAETIPQYIDFAQYVVYNAQELINKSKTSNIIQVIAKRIDAQNAETATINVAKDAVLNKIKQIWSIK